MLEAAARVFAREGLAGATTRAIADQAGVNEVTLFRHFRNKEGLIAAVVGENFGGTILPTAASLPHPTSDLRADLTALGALYEKLLRENLPLVRTLIGETHHIDNSSHETQVFRSIFLPLKTAVLDRIESAQKAGQLYRTRRADILSDMFIAMIFTGVLRRSAPQIKTDYSSAAYLEAVVDLFLHGATSAKKPR